jgi:DNA helicase-2/ATP-dependent DNA helicase PcrA
MLSELGAHPGSIAGVTFTNKAAEEMRSRLAGLAGLSSRALYLHTFHALGARLLREFGSAIGLPPTFVILDEEDATALVRERLKAHPRGGDIPGGPEGVRAAISRAKSRGESPAEFGARATGPYEELVSEIFTSYEKTRARLNAADFDDLILLPTRLITEHARVREVLHDRIRHVLVDEYQDTNPAQYAFLRALVGPARDITCVGDPDQSIYRWRGADIRIILEFEQNFPEARVITMEQNYRSTGLILEAASALITHNRQRRPKTLWTAAGAGRTPVFYQALDEIDEARFVAATIIRLEAGEGTRDAAVLYRTHAQSRALEEELTRRGLRYIVVGGTKFYARREVKDALSYLRLLSNPADGLSLKRALSAPPRGVGEATLARIAAVAEESGRPVMEILADPAVVGALPSRPRTALAGFLGLAKRLEEILASEGYSAALGTALEESGYLPWLDDRKPGEADDRKNNLKELVAAVRTAEESGVSLSDFLERAALMAELDKLSVLGASDASGEPRADRPIVLMTLHNAKGLEFRHVFLCGLEDGLLPHANSLDDPAELEEERRLLYVGLTRARETVILTAARGRRQYDAFRWGLNSRFLSEIPRTILTEVGSPEALFGGAPPPGASGAGLAPASPAPVAMLAAGADSGKITRISEDDGGWEDDSVPGPGEEVRHHRFGVGRVVSLNGRGPEMRVTVAFPRSGQKTFVAGVARLSRIKEAV